jgi:hypothetical protein
MRWSAIMRSDRMIHYWRHRPQRAVLVSRKRSAGDGTINPEYPVGAQPGHDRLRRVSAPQAITSSRSSASICSCRTASLLGGGSTLGWAAGCAAERACTATV